MNPFLLVLLIYDLVLILMGLFLSRRVADSLDFLVLLQASVVEF